MTHLDRAEVDATLVVVAKNWEIARAAALKAYDAERPFLLVDPYWESTLPDCLGAIGHHQLLVDGPAYRNRWKAIIDRSDCYAWIDDNGDTWTGIYTANSLSEESPPTRDIGYWARTSGSTGAGRLAGLSRLALERYSAWFASEFLLPTDVYCAAGSYAFDMVVNGILAPRYAGCTSALPNAGGHASVVNLLDHVKGERVSVLNLAPRLCRLLCLLLGERGETLPALRTVMLGGDTLPSSLVSELRSAAPHAEVINCYGVAEATVTSAFFRLPAEWNASRVVPIGHALPGTILSVSSHNGDGSGLLTIEGEQVARHVWDGEWQPLEATQNGRRFVTSDIVSKDAQDHWVLQGRGEGYVKTHSGVRVNLEGLGHLIDSVLGNEPGNSLVVQLSGILEGHLACLVPSVEDENELLDRLDDQLPAGVRVSLVAGGVSNAMSPSGKQSHALAREVLEEEVARRSELIGEESERLVRQVRLALFKVMGRDLGPSEDWWEQPDSLPELASLELLLVWEALQEVDGMAKFGLETLLERPTPSFAELATSSCTPVVHSMRPRVRQAKQDRTAVVVAGGCRLPGISSMHKFQRLIAEGRTILSDPPLCRAHLAQAPVGSYFTQLELERFEATARERGLNCDVRGAIWASVVEELLGVLSGGSGNVGVITGLGPDHNATTREMGLWRTTPSHVVAEIAFSLGLKGVNFCIDSACSSGLLAVSTAVRLIESGAESCVVAGGLQIFSAPIDFDLLVDAGVVSPDGTGRPLMAGSAGYSPGEGAAGVLLMERRQALRSGLPILAEVLATGFGHEGMTFTRTTPSSLEQRSLAEKTWREAGAPELGFMELHATGTPLGDPIELSTARHLASLDRNSTSVPVTSVKANIGHTHYAAGAFGLLRAVIQVDIGKCWRHHHPPDGTVLNGIEDGIYVPDKSVTLGSRAGIVHSYGITGTNVAMVIAKKAEHRTDGFPQEGDLDTGSGSEVHIQRIRHLISEGAGREDLSFDLGLKDNDLSSLEALDIADFLTAQLGREVGYDAVLGASTLESLAIDLAARGSCGEAESEDSEKPFQSRADERSTEENSKNTEHGACRSGAYREDRIDLILSIVDRLLTLVESRPGGSGDETLENVLKVFSDITGIPVSQFNHNMRLGEDIHLSSLECQVISQRLGLRPETLRHGLTLESISQIKRE